jgi:hypothetical protein
MARTARSDSPISLGLEETGSWMRKSAVKSEIGGSMPVILFSTSWCYIVKWWQVFRTCLHSRNTGLKCYHIINRVLMWWIISFLKCGDFSSEKWGIMWKNIFIKILFSYFTKFRTKKDVGSIQCETFVLWVGIIGFMLPDVTDRAFNYLPLQTLWVFLAAHVATSATLGGLMLVQSLGQIIWTLLLVSKRN